MEQPCSRCGYISDRPARFCRQCGSQLIAETEASSAATRNYAPQAAQYAEPPSAYPGYAPNQQPAWGSDQTPETTPFYRPPVAPQYQTPIAEQKSTNWGKWVLISLLTFLVVCLVGVGGLVYWGKKFVERRVGSSTADAPVVAPGSHPSSDAPHAPGLPPPPPAVGSLDDYKYPDAEITILRKQGINEVIQMTTDDDLEDVLEYYQEKFKNSSIRIKGDDGKKSVFTSLGQPMITVIVEPHEKDKDKDKTKITLTRLNIPIPKIPIPKIEIQ